MTTYYTSAKIFTSQNETSTVTAFGSHDGVFNWVGDAAAIPAGAEVVDLGDATVLPGLLDVHTHATYIATSAQAVPCTFPAVTDIPSMVEALRQHPNAGKEGWIEGWGYDESRLAEGRTPTRHDLDQVSTTQPVYVERSDCHSGICNTAALTVAGIDRHTPDPEQGCFGREPDGTPNGILTEHDANQAIKQAKGGAGFDADAEALLQTNQHFLERGLVGVTDMFCVPSSYDQRDLFVRAAQLGFLPQARYYLDFATMQEHPVRDITPTDLEGRVALAGIKLFADGAVSNRTAWLRDPYPGTNDQFGMATAPAERMRTALEFARTHGVQIAFHAMGDRAIESVIEFFEHEQPWLEHRRIPSVRIEHASLLDPVLMERMNRATMHFGVAANVNFLFAEFDSYKHNLTEDQFRRAYMIKDLYDRIPDAALTSDCPATLWADPDDPFMSMQAAVTRTAYNGADIGKDQAISVAQAVLLYTSRAARLANFTGLGQIAPGNEATFITLSQDIFTVPAHEICSTTVTGTWIRGVQEFARNA